MRARERTGAALVMLATACAPQDRLASPSPLDAPAPQAAPQAAPQEEAERGNQDDELGLAEYERLLADKETRLRAAGVLLAARGPSLDDAIAERDRGLAPPAVAPAAPSAPGGVMGGAVGEGRVATAKSRRPTKGDSPSPDASGKHEAAPPPAPPPRPKDSATREKKVQYDPNPKPTTSQSGYAAPPADDEPTSAGRCQNICDLSASTCELESKICDLAAKHADDPRYGDLCRRADEDCRQAAEACQRCSP
ncbi:hypothetical protein [Nannocystis bainbridge]|uniref:Uncharacterized protein n=1 Tax=Nannocystis bainbridge TaxID=2995303 RepID=A0ABT5DZ87_9BACT|nr:hypothetical protein [Nannocystis bainbridge]MDC0718468.1 hypothetical protein [Nannocystis bainbridge]